jgi:hypothetical protein
MNSLANSPPEERGAAFVEAASRLGIGSPVIIEKDFWVCWSLGQIYLAPGIPVPPLFKGGTSISKAYGIIKRFSEDVDLVIDRHKIGFEGGDDPIAASSGKKKEKGIEALERKCAETIQGPILKALQEQFEGILKGEWRLEVFGQDQNHQTLAFRYPPGLKPEMYPTESYIGNFVRLEFGCKGDVWPSEERIIKSYVAEAVPELFEDRTEVKVNALAPKRTFWEKATLIHGIISQGKAKPRLSRHFYDLVALSEDESCKPVLGDDGLLSAVVKHKKTFFRQASAKYDEAKRGTLRLVPAGDLLKAIRQDYEEMAEMFFEDPPPFDELLQSLRDIEARFNAANSRVDVSLPVKGEA